ncbi:MAG: SDR family NAD(P)-dependent oxidoreductase, partial [Bacteroidia bacterium]|nr:SDR family NAD(P)-dependent oxidoreductase [Bacteroidia bacterium]
MDNQFNNKTALIVGGSSGIGKETAKQLLQQGAKWVALIGYQDTKIEQAKKELSLFGEVKSFKADLTKWEDVIKAIDFVKSLEQTDILVNAVGVF